MKNVFTITAQDQTTQARAGVLGLGHGEVATPAFMPVGTNATVKAQEPAALEAMGIRLILSNAYHLYLRPGIEVIEKAGGLHRFMAWNHNILTDSGGFQIFSLARFRTTDDAGVTFRSHIDGSRHTLSPSDIIRIQTALGSDVMMPLDVCTAYGVGRGDAETAADRTTLWAKASKKAWEDTGKNNLLFGIVQGNFFHDLRKRSAEELVALDFPGYAIGGLSVGEQYGLYGEFLRHTAALLPAAKPRYVMGIGTPEHLLDAVVAGIDLFDCVFPTRTARNALLFTAEGPINIRNEKYRMDFSPPDPACACATCRTHTRAYLRHLYKTKEILASIVATRHNLFFLENLMDQIRRAIADKDFAGFRKRFLSSYAPRGRRRTAET